MKKISALIVAAGIGFAVQAQTTTVTESKEWLQQESRRLYADKEYSTALTVLSHLQEKDLSTAEKQIFDYMMATATFETDPLEGRALMLQYLDDYPESGKREVLAAYIAQSYYFGHKFKQADDWFKKADFERLSPDERERSELYYALTLQENGNGEQAKNLLSSLKLTSKRYRNDAIFHLAVIDYDNNRLQQAYEGFKSIEFDDKYHLEIPYYLAAIYLKNGEYVRAEKVAEKFLNDNGNRRQGSAMRQIQGAAFFGQKRYNDAIAPLKKYISEQDEPQRIAYYQLALSLFETGRYQDAIPMFDKCTDRNDILAQNAYLHLGIIQLKFNDITKARLAFEQAAAMTFDSNIREEALYNYALCIHQTRYSPFAESVKVFEQFLNEYPNSPHATNVNRYLVEVYMNTRNYDVALQSIEKIERPGDEILEAKQKVLYRMGVQAFIDNNMQSSIDYMKRSLELSRYNDATHSDALYWMGEALYKQKRYAEAGNSYKKVIALSDRNKGNAFYGLGYTLFQTKKYGNALHEFNNALKYIPSQQSAQRADIYNRIGDCSFYERDYATAEQYYKKSVETNKTHSDYALYRAAIAQGLLKEYDEKALSLKQLAQSHPNSLYAQQAYYELGRTFVIQEKYDQAVEAFENQKRHYPKSALSRRAATEIAMIYNRNGNKNKAMSAYKQIIRDYPHSEEAQIAAQDLKNIYVEIGKVDEYAAYAASTPGLKAMESSERDTLTYVAAEKIYGRGDISEAKNEFNRYLKNFPDGSFALDSHYYLGLIYYNQNAPKDALNHLEKIIAYPANKYSEEAMAMASELYYKDENYNKAIELYRQLAAKSTDKERRTACHMNIMRCAYILGQDDEAINAAEQLLNSDDITPEWEREALYTQAKAMLHKGMSETATVNLKKLASDTRSKQGAEAKYLLAQYYYDNRQYDNCEKEIQNYIEMSTPHTYWMARSFILLADLYIAQGRNMEAKQYLLSLQNNYSGNDDIAKLIEERMAKIGNEENKNAI